MAKGVFLQLKKLTGTAPNQFHPIADADKILMTADKTATGVKITISFESELSVFQDEDIDWEGVRERCDPSINPSVPARAPHLFLPFATGNVIDGPDGLKIEAKKQGQLEPARLTLHFNVLGGKVNGSLN